jgi:hypothetical protein
MDWKWGNLKCGGILKVKVGLTAPTETIRYPEHFAIIPDEYYGAVWAYLVVFGPYH